MADGRLIFDTKIDTSGFTNGLKGLRLLAGKALIGVTKAVVGVTAGLTAFGISAVKVGMDFEQQMSRVQAISGATNNELKKLNEQALVLGAKTSFSAKEAADGMENLASAGFNVEEMMKAMPGLLDLAAVSGRNVAMASEVAASTLRAFGLEASNTGHIADVFARAAAETNAEVYDMGEAMKYVAPVARSMGQTLEETAAAIGIMSDAGVKGSQAGTTLRGALSRLVKPTKLMRGVMSDLNIEFFDAQGNMKPLNGIISELQSSTKGLTQEQKNNAIVTLFGQEALSGMLALTEAGPEKLNELTASLINSEGAATEMARTMQNNVSSSLEQIGGALETLQIRIFQSVNEPLRASADSVTVYLDKMGTSFQESGFTGLAKVLGEAITDGIIEVSKKLPELAKLGVEVITTFVNSISKNKKALSKSMVNLGAILVKAGLTIIPKLLTVGIEIAAQFVSGFAKELPNLILLFISALQNMINTIQTNLPIFLEAATTIINSLIQGMLEAIPLMIPAISTLLLNVVTFITENIGTIADGAIQIVKALVQGIIEQLPLLIPAALQLIVAISDAIIGNLPIIIDLALQLIMALAQGLIDSLPYLIEQVPRIINSFTDAVFSKLPDIIATGVQILVALGKGLIKAIPTLIANIPQIVMAIINSFSLASFWNLGSNLISSIGNGISYMTSNIGSIARNLATSVNNGIKNIFSAGLNIGRAFILSIGRGFRSLISYISGAAKNVALGAINGIKNIFSAGFNIGRDLISGIWNGISSMTSWMKDNIFGFAKGITSSIKSFFGIESPSKVMAKEVGKWLPPGIAVGFDDAVPDLERDVNKQLNSLTDQMQKTVEAESTLTAGKIAANSNVYLPNPYDRKKNKDGTTTIFDGEITVISELDGRAVGYGTSKYSSEEMALDEIRSKF